MYNIKAGFEAYNFIYGTYPVGPQIDKFPYLPSQKYFQKGSRPGIREYRKILNLPMHDYRTRKYGGSLRYDSTEKNKLNELEMYTFLTKYIFPILVHEQKTVLRKPFIIRSDFFIYTDTKNGIVIDVFETNTRKDLGTHINIKTKKYSPIIGFPVYFVVFSKTLKEEDIDKVVNNKTIKLPENIHVLHINKFEDLIISTISKQSRDFLNS